MEHIRLALEKASEGRKSEEPAVRRDPLPRFGLNGAAVRAEPPKEIVLPKCVLDGRRLEEMRVVSYLRRHNSHIAFDMLRTRIVQMMKEQGWTSLMVTSPTPGCGKTIVSSNLAFSMAHDANKRIALVDLDLRRPRVSAVLGTAPAGDMLTYLRGEIGLSSLFSQVGDNLLLALNDSPIGSRPAEWMRDEKITSMPAQIRKTLGADLIIFDVPPALTSDDTMAFSPSVDCAIIVAAARQTTPREIEDCEQQVARTNYLGVVLNKTLGDDQANYGYGYGSPDPTS
jgi:protein-tyrosine kinase